MVFCFVQKSQNIFLSRKARNFFSEFSIRLYDENPESDYCFFFLHQNHNLFFSNIRNQNIFLEKNRDPPCKLNGPSLSTSSGSIQVYENVFSSQSLELSQLSNFSVDAFKLELLMMRSATDEKWLLELLQISSILSHFLPSIFIHFI